MNITVRDEESESVCTGAIQAQDRGSKLSNWKMCCLYCLRIYA